MKRDYVSPLLQEISVESAQMLAGSAPEYRGPVLDSTNGDQSADRSQWGSLWSK